MNYREDTIQPGQYITFCWSFSSCTLLSALEETALCTDAANYYGHIDIMSCSYYTSLNVNCDQNVELTRTWMRGLGVVNPTK